MGHIFKIQAKGLSNMQNINKVNIKFYDFRATVGLIRSGVMGCFNDLISLTYVGFINPI